MATCTGSPLLELSVVTTALSVPEVVGLGASVTVSAVAVAAVTVPTAPSLKVTVSLPCVVSKPKPLIVMLPALAARPAVLLVTTGVTVPTCVSVLAHRIHRDRRSESRRRSDRRAGSR